MTTQQHDFSAELAQTLDDLDSLPYYRDLCDKYSESFLRGKLRKVMSIPASQIRKTRGALFTFLITQHERRYNDRH